MGYKEHTAEFIAALRGGRGALDAWLECNNEAECRAAILGAIEEEREACSACVPSNWCDPMLSGPDRVVGVVADCRPIEAILMAVKARIMERSNV